MDILPVFLKSKKKLHEKKSGKIFDVTVEFFPNESEFPAAVHCHALSPRQLSVRSVVAEIKKLQAVIADPNNDLQRFVAALLMKKTSHIRLTTGSSNILVL